ncbi:nudix hydrolase [Artemisia annua]|uniref:Nudix hydrolase n=1 Tax=Artemisia annua TaxID=35608 RepID=A0A2U1NVJ9_ARTAN|nr:nudix hydrolase [Artemisia annua]
MELKKMVPMVSRSGRHLQRYNKGQQRQVVGYIPYRISTNNALVVLVISAQRKGKGMLFPKGESIEEAGVSGIVEGELGTWCFKSKGNDGYYEGHMFPLLVKEQLEFWPEKDIRRRAWLSVAKAKEVCQYTWMKEALDLLVMRLESAPLNKENEVFKCFMTRLDYIYLGGRFFDKFDSNATSILLGNSF